MVGALKPNRLAASYLGPVTNDVTLSELFNLSLSFQICKMGLMLMAPTS